jgi:hypothetical protein
MATRSDTANVREGSEPQGAALTEILQKSLLNFRVTAGAAADADIEVPDIEVGDEVVFVGHFNVTSGDIDTLADRTSEATVTEADTIQLGTTATTGDTLLVVFADLTGDDQ